MTSHLAKTKLPNWWWNRSMRPPRWLRTARITTRFLGQLIQLDGSDNLWHFRIVGIDVSHPSHPNSPLQSQAVPFSFLSPRAHSSPSRRRSVLRCCGAYLPPSGTAPLNHFVLFIVVKKRSISRSKARANPEIVIVRLNPYHFSDTTWSDSS